MSNKVMIIGTGNVGASIAYSLINQRTAVNELVLVDINKDDAEGEAMDLRDALNVAPSYIKIRSGTYDDARNCDIIVLTAGIPQKPGETRLELLKKNAKIIKNITKEIMDTGFDGIFIVVSNPMDVMTYLVWEYSDLPQNRIIGSGTVLDSARLCQEIAKHLNVNSKSVHAYQIGEHGDSEFSLWSSSTIGCQPLTSILSETTRTTIENDVRNKAYQIINKKGATYYGIGTCVVHILNTILNDERRVLTVSTYDSKNDIFYAYPSVIGRRGVYRRLEPLMTSEEKEKLETSMEILKKAVKAAQ